MFFFLKKRTYEDKIGNGECSKIYSLKGFFCALLKKRGRNSYLGQAHANLRGRIVFRSKWRWLTKTGLCISGGHIWRLHWRSQTWKRIKGENGREVDEALFLRKGREIEEVG